VQPTLGAVLDMGFLYRYDLAIQNALNASPFNYVIIDLHKYVKYHRFLIPYISLGSLATLGGMAL
jgi:hypothetical protein